MLRRVRHWLASTQTGRARFRVRRCTSAGGLSRVSLRHVRKKSVRISCAASPRTSIMSSRQPAPPSASESHGRGEVDAAGEAGGAVDDEELAVVAPLDALEAKARVERRDRVKLGDASARGR